MDQAMQSRLHPKAKCLKAFDSPHHFITSSHANVGICVVMEHIHIHTMVGRLVRVQPGFLFFLLCAEWREGRAHGCYDECNEYVILGLN